MRRFCAGTILLAASLWPVFASAATCAPPATVASLDIHDDGLGGISVPVTINGEPRRMHIWLGPHTSLANGLFDPSAIHSSVHPVDNIQTVIHSVTVHNLMIGSASADDIEVDVYPAQPKPDDTVGLLGTGILANFDMELDFPAGKFNLYQHEDCPGGGVQWPWQAAIPFELKTLHKLAFPMTLDGKPVTATIDFNNFLDYVSFRSAASLFAIGADDPKIETLSADRPATTASFAALPPTLTLQRYRFGSLSSGDFVLHNPNTALFGKPDGPNCDGKTRNDLGHGVTAICFGFGDISLGLMTLKTMKLYIAFKDQMIYLAGPK